VEERAAVESHSHAVRGAYGIFAAEKCGDLLAREVIDLRAVDRAQARRHRQIKAIESPFLPLPHAVEVQRQPVARDQRAALPASETAAQICRYAAKNRLDLKTAFDRNVEQGTAYERADPHDLPAL
jgi:hypothetical protein